MLPPLRVLSLRTTPKLAPFLSVAPPAPAPQASMDCSIPLRRRVPTVVLCTKSTDDSRIIEHFEGKWQMKSATSKGKNLAFAQIGSGCALEACVAAVWNVLDSGKWGNQTNVKMSTGAEAEAQASSLNARIHPRNSPPALLPPRFAALVVPSDALC